MLTKRGLQNIHGKLSGQSGDDITRSLAGQALLQLNTKQLKDFNERKKAWKKGPTIKI